MILPTDDPQKLERIMDFVDRLQQSAKAELKLDGMTNKEIATLIYDEILPDMDMTSLVYVVIEKAADRLAEAHP